MRFRHKKIFISGVAVTVAGVLGVGALLHTSVSVQASSAMMPGIETIVSETSQAEPFRILEIVDDTKDAEIGYYVSGQEPYIKLYEYTPDDGSQPIHFSSLEEGLSQLPTRELRQEFANNIKIAHNEDGKTTVAASKKIRDVREICYHPGQTDPGQGNEISEYPLTYEEYQERYFLNSGETEKQALANGWKIVDLAETRTDVINGYYQPNSAGTGNYTKQKQSYYPIRDEKRNGDNADGASTAKYRENIQSFFSGESVSSGAPYNLVFEPVDNNTVNSAFADNKKGAELQKEYDYANGAYGYYENVYGDLTQSIVEGIEKGQKGQYTFPGETSAPEAKPGVLISTNEQLNSAKERFTSDTFDDGALSNDAMISDGGMEVYDGQVPTDTQPSQYTSPSGDIQYENNTDDFFTGEVGSSMIGMSYVNGMDYTVMNATYGGQGYSAMKTSFEDDFSSEAGGFGDDSYTEPQEPYSYGSQEPYTYEQNETVTAPSSQSEGENTDENGVQASEENHGTVLEQTNKAGTQADPYIYIGESILEYPYYKYTPVGDLKYVKDLAAKVKGRDEQTEEKGELITRQDKDITVDEAGQYWYWKTNETTGIVEKQPLSIVTHRQAVAFKDIRTISEDITYNYYYRVKEVYFCCKGIEIKAEDGTTTTDTSTSNSFTYYGWYYPTYPANEEIYLEIGEGDTHVPTYYISEPSYTLTPGKGNYDFIPSEDDPNAKEQTVEVNRIYYKGGYTNHDWLKRYVFHLSPDGEDGDTEEEKQQAAAEFNNFDIKVGTVTAESLSVDGTVTTTAADEVSAAAFYAEGDTEAFGDDPEAEMQDVSSDTVDFQVDGSTEGEVTESEIIEGENASGQIPEVQSIEGQIAEGETSEVEPMISESQEEVEIFEGSESSGLGFAGESFAGEETDEAGFASEENTDEVTFYADSDSAEVAAVGSSGDSGNLPLSEYDLIYINTSRLNKEQAQALVNLAGNKKAFIINQDKVGADNPVYAAFFVYVKATDADQHYVTQNVYFFKRTISTASETTGNTAAAVSYLVNTNFHTNFNRNDEDGSGFTDGTAGNEDPVQGFEEILEYIKSENQYRSIGSGSTGGDTTSDTTELLTLDISQARAVEYILNYLHKRVINNKPVINVLEIEPAKVDEYNKLTEGQVLEWLGYDYSFSVETCSEEKIKENAKKENMLDGDISTIWHTNYSGQDSCKDEPHKITITFDFPQEVSGLIYVPRNSNSNGRFISFDIELLDVEGKVLYKGGEKDIENSATKKAFTFTDKEGNLIPSVKNVNKINLKNIKGVNGYGSCAELQPVLVYGEYGPKVNITTMTSSEYVGHIDDLNTKYDMIYFGGAGRQSDNKLAKLINGEEKLLYTHTGERIKLRDNRMKGLLNSDYYSNGKIITEESFARGSGNDITMQQVNALLEFAKSGYPIVISDNLYNDDGSVNTERVDNSSYVYAFLTEVSNLKQSYHNIYTSEEAAAGNIDFFVNLPKPVIKFTKGGKPKSAIGNENGPSDEVIEDELRYEFSIEDQAEVSTVSASYDCELFVDLNCDGNFSSTEKLDDIQIQDSKGNVMIKKQNGKYELKLDEVYTVTRSLPQDYSKLITWKLKISNNTRAQIWTTEQGYCKPKRSTEKPKINVLQIYSVKKGNNGDPTWILTDDTEFMTLINNIDDFEITITAKSVTDYVNDYKSGYTNSNKNILDDYDMLIIGFADMYSNISNDEPAKDKPGAVDAILNFIKAGKSVLFSHDTTAHFNNNSTNGWGQSFNSVLRTVVGLDRYGVTSFDIGQIVKKGVGLEQGSNEWNSVWNHQFYLRGDNTQSQNGDMAFEANSNKKKTYGEIQGFTNSILSYDLGSYYQNCHVSQVNEGAITEYPFQISDSFSVADTHGQYYQLAMEEDSDHDGNNDIIVWYCLAGEFMNKDKNNGLDYSASPNDVRNNYYLYSKGNVMYTGVGHSTVNIENNTMEKKLFINAIVASYRASAVDPKVKFVDDFSRTAGEINSEYYMTDQYMVEDGEQNVVGNSKEFYFKVDDYNMIATNNFTDNIRSLKLELFIDDENGSVGTDLGLNEVTGKVSRLNVDVYENDWNNRISKNSNGEYTARSGNVYGFSINDLEQYVKGQNGYRNNVKIYAKVSTHFMLYGQETSGEGVGTLSLQQRQLFDLD